MVWNTLYMKPKSPVLGFALFADHLPDSFLKPLEFISYLKVICAQSWGPKEPIWDIRSPKMRSQQAHSWIRMKKNTLYEPETDLQVLQGWPRIILKINKTCITLILTSRFSSWEMARLCTWAWWVWWEAATVQLLGFKCHQCQAQRMSRDLTFTWPLGCSLFSNKHCEVLVSCSDRML